MRMRRAGRSGTCHISTGDSERLQLSSTAHRAWRYARVSIRLSNMTIATAEGFAGVVSQRVEAERHTLAARWLGRLHELLTVDANEVFPSEQLLDHIPILIGEIAVYLRAPADEEIAANTVVIEKARELGRL